jgi:glucose uptake protein GlcU
LGNGDTVTFGTHTEYGIEGDGVFMLIGGALFAVFFLLHYAPWQRVVATLIAFGLLVVAVVEFSDVQNHVEKANAEAKAVSATLTASVGVGLWMVLVGSVGVVGGELPPVRRTPL